MALHRRTLAGFGAMTCGAGVQRLTVWTDGVPHTEHEEAWLSDPHRPTHALDGNLSSMVFFCRCERSRSNHGRRLRIQTQRSQLSKQVSLNLLH